MDGRTDGRTYGHLRPTLLRRLGGVNRKNNNCSNTGWRVKKKFKTISVVTLPTAEALSLFFHSKIRQQICNSHQKKISPQLKRVARQPCVISDTKIEHLFLYRMHVVPKMQSTAADVTSSVVCVSVCCSCLAVCSSHQCVVQNQLNRSRRHLGSDSRGHKKPCIRWGQDPPRERAILGVVRLQFYRQSLWCML